MPCGGNRGVLSLSGHHIMLLLSGYTPGALFGHSPDDRCIDILQEGPRSNSTPAVPQAAVETAGFCRQATSNIPGRHRSLRRHPAMSCPSFSGAVVCFDVCLVSGRASVISCRESEKLQDMQPAFSSACFGRVSQQP